MDSLTVKELRLLNKGLGLSTAGLKSELIERIANHLSNFNSAEIDDSLHENPQDISQNNGHRVTMFSKIKTHFIHPLRNIHQSISNPLREFRFSTTIPSEHHVQHNQNSSISWLMYLKILIGVFGGMHSIAQLFLFYFSEPMQIILPRNW